MNSILNQKISAAASVVPENFRPTNFLNYSSTAYVKSCLNQLGIYDDDLSLEILLSEDTKEGDARKIFCENCDPTFNLPIARFRRLWSILKEGAKSSGTSTDNNFTSLVEALKPVSQLSDKELLERYISGKDSETEKELKSRSHDRNFVVFSGKEQINIDMTLKMLRDARRREMPKTYFDGKNAYVLYKIGEYPNTVRELCPITGDFLFEGYSEKLGVNWESLPLEGRQFIWVLKDQGVELKITDIRELLKIYSEQGLDGLKLIYPKIGIIFEDLKSTENLPSLKANSNSNSRTKQDPFGKRY